MTDHNTPGGPAPGWYPDGQGGQRYWDGMQWTDQTMPLAAAPPPATDPDATRLPGVTSPHAFPTAGAYPAAGAPPAAGGSPSYAPPGAPGGMPAGMPPKRGGNKLLWIVLAVIGVLLLGGVAALLIVLVGGDDDDGGGDDSSESVEDKEAGLQEAAEELAAALGDKDLHAVCDLMSEDLAQEVVDDDDDADTCYESADNESEEEDYQESELEVAVVEVHLGEDGETGTADYEGTVIDDDDGDDELETFTYAFVVEDGEWKVDDFDPEEGGDSGSEDESAEPDEPGASSAD